MADLTQVELPNGVTYDFKDNSKLVKTTYEYNTEIAFGSTGKLLIGKFQCYDSNVTITIQSTTYITYYAVAVLATQNIDTAGGGTFTWNTYGDANNTVTPNLYAKYASGSNWIEIYFSPNNWSKNLIHIQANALKSDPTNICESVSEIPSSATRKPTNTFGTSPKFTDTTYTFANGTNGFTVTPSGGSAQTVTVTPSIANNVTGSGTSGYIAKFNGGNTITNGPALGSSTTTFLRNDGQWAVPSSSGSSGNKIFITEPTPPYSVGDLWLVEDNNISVCVTARASGSFDSDDWGSAIETLSAEELQSTIASAIAGAVTVVTGNGESGGNIILKMNSSNVPYELLVTDSPDNITASTARIYRWDANGLRFSSTGYNGTYTTLINTSGQIPAQYLTGAINAGLVAIQNFTAAMIHGGVLTRGRANNQDGTIEVYDANGTLIAEVGNLGLKFYGPGTGSDRPYYLINTNGFIGYTKVDDVWTQTVKVAFDEFRMIKGYVRDELDIGGMIKMIPMTNGSNSGIVFVAST